MEPKFAAADEAGVRAIAAHAHAARFDVAALGVWLIDPALAGWAPTFTMPSSTRVHTPHLGVRSTNPEHPAELARSLGLAPLLPVKDTELGAGAAAEGFDPRPWDGVGPSVRHPTLASIVDRAHAVPSRRSGSGGLPVVVWVVDNEHQLAVAISSGADGLISNEPLALRGLTEAGCA